MRRAAGPCEDANLTERHTRSGRRPFPDAATARYTLQEQMRLTCSLRLNKRLSKVAMSVADTSWAFIDV